MRTRIRLSSFDDSSAISCHVGNTEISLKALVEWRIFLSFRPCYEYSWIAIVHIFEPANLCDAPPLT